MTHACYFERDGARSHLTLAEWRAAVAAVPGVRLAPAAQHELGAWMGYWVNPACEPGQQFHDLPDRVEDAEVYLPGEGRWRPAFYWHQRPESDLGVVTFESVPETLAGEPHPVWVAARALAQLLRAEVVGEDETAYES
jgi:hypothetical protein